MNWKKSLKMALATGTAALSLMGPVAFAEEAAETATPAAEAQAAENNGATEITPEEALDYYQNSGYKYTSQRYGYSIICPQKPNVIPASTMDESARGDVLIFQNEGYDIINAWIILVDAFDEKELPKDIGTRSEEEQKKFIEHIMGSGGYEFVRLTDVQGQTGIYCVTAKVLDIDTNGDGKIDETVTADTQMVKTFFRGQYGGRFSVQLIDNPELTQAGVAIYQLGMLTFQEWPSQVTENGQNQVKRDSKQQDNKDNKDKKEKKDKK